MAEVENTSQPNAAEQYRALLQMRFILLRRGLRTTGSRVSFVLRILVQLSVFLFAALVGVGTGFVIYEAVSENAIHAGQSSLLVLSVVWQLLVMLRSTISHEVGRNLLRFPLRFTTYATLWTLSGMLGFTTIAGASAGIGIFFGAAIAGTPYFIALLAGLLFFLFNFALSRVLYLWLERFMAHRRTREFLLIAFSLVGVLPQFLRIYGASILRFVPAPVRHAMVHTPPPMLMRALMTDATSSARWSALGITLAVVAVLVTLVLYRLLQEFRGEDLHESVAGHRETAKARTQYTEGRASFERSVPFAVFQNEISKLRHSGSAVYQLVTPLLMVIFFGLRMAAKAPSMLLPGGVMYLSLSIMSNTLNSLGSDAAGAQIYMLAPIRLRDVMLGKNLYAMAMFGAQFIVLLAITFFVGAPKLPYAIYAVLFAIFALAAHLWVGNITSIRSAAKVDLSRVNLQSVRSQRRATNIRSSWRALLVGLGVPAIGVGLGLAGMFWSMPWLPSLVMLVLAAAVLYLYRTRLDRFDHITIADMEPALTALTKTS